MARAKKYQGNGIYRFLQLHTWWVTEDSRTTSMFEVTGPMIVLHTEKKV